MRIKVSDYIVKRLAKEGVTTIFGYQGGNISHLIDSIGHSNEVHFIETYHEQGAAFAANAYAQLNETLGVAIASSGPGAINLLNGVANAFCDSIPCLFFTGDVNTSAKKIDGSKRQNAFQEVNTLLMAKPITKYCVSVNHENEIVTVLDKAISIAMEGRRGPVLINLPHDIQRNFIEVESIGHYEEGASNKDNAAINTTIEYLKASKRPVILVGGALKSARGRYLIDLLLTKWRVPVVCSLLGMDVIPHSHDCYRGVIGSYGNRGANLILKYADLILVLGSRLDDRQVSPTDTKEFENKVVIHVDIDENELHLKLKESISINSDIHTFLYSLCSSSSKGVKYDRWFEASKQLTDIFPSYHQEADLAHPNDFLHELSVSLDAIYTFDVGNNQMHSLQSVFVRNKSHVLSSGGLGSMGYSLPAAIGACYSKNAERVICISGDGGLQMNLQEMQTVVFHNLPINIIVLNNNALGMIYHLQKKMFTNRFYGTVDGYSAPNFSLLSKAYGFEYIEVSKKEEMQYAISQLKKRTHVFVDFKMSADTCLIPEIGAGSFKQEPVLSQQQQEIINTLLENG